MKMGMRNINDAFSYEGIAAHMKPTAFELSIAKAESRMQKMLASPLVEALDRHEAVMNSMVSSSALQAIEMQQKALENIPSQALIDSTNRLLENPMCSMIESMGKTLEAYYQQHNVLAGSLAKTLYNGFSQFTQSDEAIRGMFENATRIVSAAETAARAMSGITDSCLRGISAIEKALSSYDVSPFLGLSDYLNPFHVDDFDEKNEALNNFGWFMIAELPESIVDEIYVRRNAITQKEVDALIAQHFRNNRCQELKRIVNNWKHLPYFKTRQVVFHDALVFHSRRSFNASTTLISLQFEGVLTDFVRGRIMNPTHNKWAEKALSRITELTNDLTMAAMSLEDWIVCSYVLERIDEVFTTNFSPADPNSCPNTSRHKIAHGQATTKETEANSLRRFLFMNELFKLFTCLENEYQLAS